MRSGMTYELKPIMKKSTAPMYAPTSPAKFLTGTLALDVNVSIAVSSMPYGQRFCHAGVWTHVRQRRHGFRLKKVRALLRAMQTVEGFARSIGTSVLELTFQYAREFL